MQTKGKLTNKKETNTAQNQQRQVLVLQKNFNKTDKSLAKLIKKKRRHH